VLFPDAEPAEDTIQYVFRINRADDAAKLVECQSQLGGNQFLTLPHAGRGPCSLERRGGQPQTIATAISRAGNRARLDCHSGERDGNLFSQIRDAVARYAARSNS